MKRISASVRACASGQWFTIRDALGTIARAPGAFRSWPDRFRGFATHHDHYNRTASGRIASRGIGSRGILRLMFDLATNRDLRFLWRRGRRHSVLVLRFRRKPPRPTRPSGEIRHGAIRMSGAGSGCPGGRAGLQQLHGRQLPPPLLHGVPLALQPRRVPAADGRSLWPGLRALRPGVWSGPGALLRGGDLHDAHRDSDGFTDLPRAGHLQLSQPPPLPLVTRRLRRPRVGSTATRRVSRPESGGPSPGGAERRERVRRFRAGFVTTRCLEAAPS